MTPGLISQVMDLAPGRGFAQIEGLWRDSHWRAQLSAGQRLRWGGLYGYGAVDDSRAVMAGLGVTW